MDKVQVTLDVPKEAKEVIDFIDKVLEKLLTKAPLESYAELFITILPAIDGIGQVKEELKGDGKDELVAYLVHKIMGRLLS